MSPQGFQTRRRPLQALLWSGLFLTSRSEAVSGPAAGPAPGETPAQPLPKTTVTIPIAYRVSAAPGDDAYALLGCYGAPQLGSEVGGHVFGPAENHTTPGRASPGDMTAASCLGYCGGLKKPDGSLLYAYVGLRNGR